MSIELTDEEAGAISVILEGIGYAEPTVIGVLASLVAKGISPHLYLAVSVIKLGYRVFKNNVNDAARTCKGFRGFRKQLCMSNYEILALEDRAWKMKQAIYYDTSDILVKKLSLLNKKIKLKQDEQARLIKNHMEGKIT